MPCEPRTTNPTDFLADDFLSSLRRMAARYEALARAECRRQGVDPDASISDAGHVAWELVGYEAARREVPDVE